MQLLVTITPIDPPKAGALTFADCPASTTLRPLTLAERLEYCSEVPPGFETVLGWYAKRDPWFILTGEPWVAEHTQRDGFWLMHRSRERGIPAVWVKAPAVLRDQGIAHVRAYPIDLIEERMSA